MKISEILKYINGNPEGDIEKEINNVAKIENAKEDEITFISNPLYQKYFSTTKAGAVLVREDFEYKEKPENLTVIRVSDPYLAFLELIELFSKEEDNYIGISDNCYIGEQCDIPDDVYIGNFTSIGKRVKIGSGTKIYSNCTIENDVEIGSNCIIYPNVSIYHKCKIGDCVIIHSGVVIGSDGFGFAKQQDNTYKKIPHKGIVVIEDNVEIGSNTTIDRATIGETRICKGVKLDNQIQIAHNVYIGENTVIAGQVGISGSVKIGKRCMIGGQSGFVGHITICDDVIIGASVGISKSITKPGIYIGYRGKPYYKALKEEAAIKQLPELIEKLKKS